MEILTVLKDILTAVGLKRPINVRELESVPNKRFVRFTILASDATKFQF